MSATLERPQHEQARERANEIRIAMARRRAHVKACGTAGFDHVAEMLERPDELTGRMKLGYLLRSIDRVSHTRAARIAAVADVSTERRIGPAYLVRSEPPPLTLRQRAIVVAELRRLGRDAGRHAGQRRRPLLNDTSRRNGS